MRFMMIVKANRDSEAGALPSEKLLAASDISVCGALPNRRLFGAGGVWPLRVGS